MRRRPFAILPLLLAASLAHGAVDPDLRHGISLITAAQSGESEAVHTLGSFIAFCSPATAVELVRGVGRTNQAFLGPALLPALRSQQSELQLEAILACDRLKAGSTSPEVRLQLGSREAKTVMAAAHYAGTVRDDEAIPALIAQLPSGDADVQGACAQALSAITGQKLGSDERAWTQWYELRSAEVDALVGKARQAVRDGDKVALIGYMHDLLAVTDLRSRAVDVLAELRKSADGELAELATGCLKGMPGAASDQIASARREPDPLPIASANPAPALVAAGIIADDPAESATATWSWIVGLVAVLGVTFWGLRPRANPAESAPLPEAPPIGKTTGKRMPKLTFLR